MKINLVKQSGCNFNACTDQDMESLMKLKNGEVYSFEIKKARNYRFHKKYFSLISCTWDCLTEQQIEHFKNSEILRKTLEVAAGHCEVIYSIPRKEFIEIPKSIAFEKMDEYEFSKLYEEVKRVIFNYVLKGRITIEQFESNLANF